MALARPELVPESPTATLISNTDDDLRVQMHPGYGLTARTIVAAFREAELGYPQWQCDLFADVIEGDGHLRSQLETRNDAVGGRPWVVQAGGDAPEDLDAAAALESALHLVPNMAETLAHQLKSVWLGYSPSEIMWDRVDGYVAPVWFANVQHRRFTVGREGSLRLRTKSAPDGEPLYPGQWWIGRNPLYLELARAGLMRTAAWWSFFKRLSVRDWVVFAERFGLPYVTGEYEQGTSEEDKDVLKRAVQRLGTEGIAVYAAGCKIVVHTVHDGGKSSDVHGAIMSACNSEISKLVTGATLTSDSGGPGSFALGQVHADQAYAGRAADGNKLGLRFQVDVGQAFVQFNRLKAKPPLLKINVVPDLDPLTRVQIQSIAANELGMELDEEQLRQEHNLKKPVGKPVKGTKIAAVDIGVAGEPQAKPRAGA